MKKITSILALFFMCFGIAVQAASSALPEMSTDGNIKWYVIKNVRKSTFATFAGVDQQITQQQAPVAGSFFYFTGSKTADVATVKIHNDGTDMLLGNDVRVWNAEGHDWYIAKKADSGLAISRDASFSGSNNCWNDYQGKGQLVDYYFADDSGSIWEIVTPADEMRSVLASMDSKFLGTYANDPAAREKINQWIQQAEAGNNQAFIDFFAFKANLKAKAPEEGKVYLVKNAYTEYYVQQHVEKGLYEGEKPMWGDMDDANKSFYWKIVAKGNGYSFQNLSSDKYIKTFGEMTPNQAEAAEFGIAALGQNQFNIKLGNDCMHTNGHANGAGKGSNIVGWPGGVNSASSWYIMESEWAPVVDVTYDYYIDNVKLYSKVKAQKVGSAYEAPVVDLPHVQNFISCSIENPGTVTESNAPVKVVCQEKLPFQKSQSFETAKWYSMTMTASKYFFNYAEGATSMDLNRNSSMGEDQDLWCLVGNVFEGFKIYNKKAGASMILSSPTDMKDGDGNTFPILVNESSLAAGNNTTWDFTNGEVIDGAQGFFMNQHGFANNRVNYRGHKLAYWTGGADAGSTILFVEPVSQAEYVAQFLAENSKTAGYVGSYTKEQLATLANATTVAELNEFMAANEVIKLIPGKYYRIKNYSRNLSVGNGNLPFGQGAYLSNTFYPTQQSGDRKQCAQVSVGTTSLADAGAVWQFVADGAGFKLLNMNTGKYIGTPANKVDNHASLQDSVQNAGVYEVKAGAFKSSYKLVCDGGHLHASTLGAMYYPEDGASDWFLAPANELEVNLNQVEGTSWSSLYLPFDVTLPNGLEAYTGVLNATEAGDMYMTMNQVKDVPAGNGVILKGADAKYTLNIATAESVIDVNNLQGSNVEQPLLVSDPDYPEDPAMELNGQFLVLGYTAEFGVGLYNPLGDKLKANKAYIRTINPFEAKVVKFNFGGETTGVEGVEVENGVDVYYDLSGRRVANPVKGIYVKNGKKVYVK